LPEDIDRMNDRPGFATRCVHAGELDDAHGAPHTPIYNTTTFRFPNTAAVLDILEGRAKGAIYTRYGFNPTLFALEEKLAALEDAAAALAFCSGMAAESALFLTHGRGGIVCVGDAYGGTMELLASQLPMLGVPTRFLLVAEIDRLDATLAAGAGLVFFETPTNPRIEVIDVAAVAQVAHDRGALVVVDNTFASPVNQNPLALGADLVVHSATKYLGGHSDVTAGAVMGPKALVEPIWNWRKNLGTAIAPETAALLLRSLRTLPVRVERQNATALAVAQAMARHPRVARVFHPGLPDSPGHDVARRQMRGYGGMVTLELALSGAQTTAFVDRLRLFALAASLGGPESLAIQPAFSTHYGLGPDERARRGIGDNMVRLSIGLEDPADLLADLGQALGD
jgi:cystathionine beta-lyase/cystathionine gamma-synthase